MLPSVTAAWWRARVRTRRLGGRLARPRGFGRPDHDVGGDRCHQRGRHPNDRRGRADRRGRPAYERTGVRRRRTTRRSIRQRATSCRSASTCRGVASCRGSRPSTRFRSIVWLAMVPSRSSRPRCQLSARRSVFENAFPGLVREMVRNGAQLLVVPVNNASYGFTAASEQHLQMSRMRAVETRQPLGRQCGCVGHHRRRRSDGPGLGAGLSFSRMRRFGPPCSRTWRRTPFVRWGDWVVWAAGALLGLSLLGTRRVATLYPRGVWYMRSRDGRRS